VDFAEFYWTTDIQFFVWIPTRFWWSQKQWASVNIVESNQAVFAEENERRCWGFDSSTLRNNYRYWNDNDSEDSLQGTLWEEQKYAAEDILDVGIECLIKQSSDVAEKMLQSSIFNRRNRRRVDSWMRNWRRKI